MCHRIFHLFFKFYLSHLQFMGFMTSSLGSDWYRENQWALPRIFRCSALAPRAAAAAGPGGGAAAAGAGAGGRARGRGGAAGQVREDAAAGTGAQVTRPTSARWCVVMLCLTRLRNRPAHLAPRTNSVPSQLPWFEDDVPQTPIDWYSMFYFYYYYIQDWSPSAVLYSDKYKILLSWNQETGRL